MVYELVQEAHTNATELRHAVQVLNESKMIEDLEAREGQSEQVKVGKQLIGHSH